MLTLVKRGHQPQKRGTQQRFHTQHTHTIELALGAVTQIRLRALLTPPALQFPRFATVLFLFLIFFPPRLRNRLKQSKGTGTLHDRDAVQYVEFFFFIC